MQVSDSALLRQQAFIGGARTDAESGGRFAVTDPTTGAVLDSVPELGRTETEREAAALGLPAWRAKTAKQRATEGMDQCRRGQRQRQLTRASDPSGAAPAASVPFCFWQVRDVRTAATRVQRTYRRAAHSCFVQDVVHSEHFRVMTPLRLDRSFLCEPIDRSRRLVAQV